MFCLLDNNLHNTYNLDSLDCMCWRKCRNMVHSWQLQDAKNKLSQVIDDAVHLGPQIITKRGTQVAIVLSYAEYRKLISSQLKLSDFFQRSPLAEIELDLSRDKSPLREAFE